MSRFKGAALLLLLIAGICLLTPPQGSAQKPGRRVRTIRFEPNVHAPDLYADTLKMQFTLVNLPGSEVKGSYWEGQYKLYFLPEGELQKNRSSNPEPDDFPNKILLAEGSFRADQLKTLDGRTFIRGPVAFKSKVPDHMRTKFANILTSFSVKIYDAKLKQSFYKSSMFIAHPFDDDERYSASEKFMPRRVVYTSFFATPEGDLFTSQWRRERNDMSW